MAVETRMTKVCAGCGLRFGGDHIAVPCYVKELGYICQWCYREYKQYGMDAFTRDFKRERREFKEERRRQKK